MAKIGLIFTTDYEIFGNGTGCVEKCMIEPTEKMAALLEEAGASLTVFVDLCEYWAFEAEFRKGNLKKDWAGMIRTQLRDLLERGHDVQLHFHPQWLDYSFDGKNWKLNYGLWRIGSLKYEDKEQPERGLRNLFARGKQTLEEMLRPVNPDYKCEIFRAGAWSIQPEEEVLRAMCENGFRIDSTVAPGISFRDDYSYYDFKTALKLQFWHVKSDLLRPEEQSGILEVPIYTAEVGVFRKLDFLRLKKAKGLRVKPEGCNGTAMASQGKSTFKKLRELLGEKKGMFVYSDATSCEEMVYFAQKAIRQFQINPEKLVPIVSISHPKTFANETELTHFLAWAKGCVDIEFINYQRLLE